MVNLPAPETIAQLVNQATQMLFQVPIEYAGKCPDGLPEVDDGHTVIVPLIGAPMYIVTTTATPNGGATLASVMFECPIDQASPDMIEDSLRELTNILAGQVKSILCQEHQIGLPSRLDSADTLAGARLHIGQAGEELDISIAEFAAPTFE